MYGFVVPLSWGSPQPLVSSWVPEYRPPFGRERRETYLRFVTKGHTTCLLRILKQNLMNFIKVGKFYKTYKNYTFRIMVSPSYFFTPRDGGGRSHYSYLRNHPLHFKVGGQHYSKRTGEFTSVSPLEPESGGKPSLLNPTTVLQHHGRFCLLNLFLVSEYYIIFVKVLC